MGEARRGGSSSWIGYRPGMITALLAILAAAAPGPQGETPSAPETVPAIRAQDIAGHIRVLASDAFGGRGPGSEGEARAVAYIQERFEAAGLEPAGAGGWTQDVAMLELTPDDAPKASFEAAGEERALVSGRDVMITSPIAGGDVRVDSSEVVFAGYGVVAPEYGWNDYEGIDVRGKTVVVLVNDPGFRSGDPALFRGGAMTYYGRWTYKYEEAERQGAAACLIVHEDDAAGYGWIVVNQSWGRPQLQLAAGPRAENTRIRGWITLEAARSLFAAAGADLGAMMASASTREARPHTIDARFSSSLANRVSRLVSPNVLGKVVGAERPDEYVLVCAHWDHLGTREGSAKEDNIFNGAVDNASGTAAMLELAEAVGAQDPPPARTVVFLGTTSEEKGLLGSKHYASAPLYPLARTVAGLNIDGINVLGPMEDVVVVGYGASQLDDDLRVVARAQGRRVVPESTPERGYYFRSDHFPLAKVGVPMLYAGKGTVSVEHGVEWVKEQEDDYLQKRYHRVRDEFDPSWDLEGAAQDVRLYHALVQMWATDARWRAWSPTSEFRAAREASLRAARGR